MALYDRKQFAELCGFGFDNSGRAKISMWEKRGKIVIENNLIDSENAINRDWISKQVDVNAGKQIETDQKQEFTTEKPQGIPVKTNVTAPVEGIYNLDKQLKQQELEKKQVETRILNLKEDKIRGEVIPTAIAVTILSQFSQQVTTQFKNGLEDVLTLFAKQKDLNVNEVAEMRAKLTSIINNSIDKAVDSSKSNMDSIIKDFSLKKEVGERE